MATTAAVSVYRGDTPVFRFHIRKRDGDDFVLTGYTVYFAVKTAATATTYVINKACSILSAAYGTAEVALTATDTGTAGTFVAEVELRGPGGGPILTTNQFTLTISPDLRAGAGS